MTDLRKTHVAILVTFAMIFSSLATYTSIQIFSDDKTEIRKTEYRHLPNEFSKIEQAYELITKGYIENVDPEHLVEGAVEGMLATLGDPYSVYMNEEKAKEFNRSLDSSFEGIGAEMSEVDGKVIIVSPFKNSPAEKAGLKPFDEIVAVDGQDVKGQDLYEVTSKVRGKKGTTVSLQILREGLSEPISIEVIRDKIPIETVFSEIIEQEEKKIGYITITSFAVETGEDFLSRLNTLEKEKIDGLIIDVRGNPGGLLQSVKKIAGELVPKEKPMFQIEGRDQGQEQYFSKLAEKKPYPIAVLTDKGSASASEILAAALKEAGGYPTIGETTFGKGTVQQQVDLGDKSHIKLTMYKWLTPDGNWIHGQGIKPDIYVVQPDLYHVHPLQIDQPLSKDMNNGQVKNAQLILKSLGYEPGRVDGYYSETTETAVKRFQREHNLPDTGIINEKTVRKMEKKVAEAKRKKENDRQLQMALRYFQYQH